MALTPYPRALARVRMPQLLRFPDIPAGAVRQVALDVSDWSQQVPSDPPTTVSVALTPSNSGLSGAGAAVSGDVVGLTLTARTAGAGTDYAVVFTVSTAAGRVEVFTARILVTAPGS